MLHRHTLIGESITCHILDRYINIYCCVSDRDSRFHFTMSVLICIQWKTKVNIKQALSEDLTQNEGHLKSNDHHQSTHSPLCSVVHSVNQTKGHCV